ncbi:hypothetical protein Tsubulata_013598 [Turnera subulata]|uniref:Structural polyprotein n=1 Tax=Turnera subulata TaxID=218843 RepID=A0A9Q0JBR6_9ROSI|nr:hypothetical protein Tsubulata_013598 [Turnera subulata]
MGGDSLAFLLLFSAIALLSASSPLAVDHTASPNNGGGRRGFGRRGLLSFKETPHGSNLTFECSPSGPCVPCLYSEKNDKKYRCSETGYRIPLKCVESKLASNKKNAKSSHNSRSAMEIFHENAKPPVMLHEATTIKPRSLADELSTENGSQFYITYRSCIPAVNEEKLSVIGFEGIVLFALLISSTAVYYRKKQTATMSGVGSGRIQMTRF